MPDATRLPVPVAGIASITLEQNDETWIVHARLDDGTEWKSHHVGEVEARFYVLDLLADRA